jgi:hypothetical protein
VATIRPLGTGAGSGSLDIARTARNLPADTHLRSIKWRGEPPQTDE